MLIATPQGPPSKKPQQAEGAEVADFESGGQAARPVLAQRVTKKFAR